MTERKNLLPVSLMKKPKTLEEFQEFYFHWEPAIGEMYRGDVKEMKLVLWNARKIKKTELTKSEIKRIYNLYEGYDYFDSGTQRNDFGNRYRHTFSEKLDLKRKEYDVTNIIKYKGWKDSDNPKDLDQDEEA